MGLSWGAPLIVHGDALSVSIADLCIHIHSQNQHSMRVITHDVPSWELHSHAVLVLADANLINDSSSGACNMLLPPNNYACKAWKKLPTTRHPWCLNDGTYFWCPLLTLWVNNWPSKVCSIIETSCANMYMISWAKHMMICWCHISWCQYDSLWLSLWHHEMFHHHIIMPETPKANKIPTWYPKDIMLCSPNC